MAKKKNKQSEEAKKAHKAAVDNIIAHFENVYISSRLSAFQDLCRDLDVEVGTSIKKCRMNIKSAHVNIHDFVRVQQRKGDVSKIKFPSYKALQDDIRSSPSRRFPLGRAKANELLKAMLIFI